MQVLNRRRARANIRGSRLGCLSDAFFCFRLLLFAVPATVRAGRGGEGERERRSFGWCYFWGQPHTPCKCFALVCEEVFFCVLVVSVSDSVNHLRELYRGLVSRDFSMTGRCESCCLGYVMSAVGSRLFYSVVVWCLGCKQCFRR